MKQLEVALKKWNKEVFGNIDSKIDALEREIEKVDIELEEAKVDEVSRQEKALS